MQSLQLVLVTGLLTGGFALAGVVLGPWLKGRSDHVQWRRQLRLDAYTELYAAAIDLVVAASSDDEDAFSPAEERLVRAESRVRLVAPGAVREASFALAKKLSRVLRNPKLRENDDEADEIRRLIEVFADAARQDLGTEESGWKWPRVPRS
jgi:hypothetical protein